MVNTVNSPKSNLTNNNNTKSGKIINDVKQDNPLLFAADTQPQVQSSSEEKEVKEDTTTSIVYTKEQIDEITQSYNNIKGTKKKLAPVTKMISQQYFMYCNSRSKTQEISPTKGRVNILIPKDTNITNIQIAIEHTIIIVHQCIIENWQSFDGLLISMKHEKFVQDGISPISLDIVLKLSHMITTNQITLYFIAKITEEQLIKCLKIINKYLIAKCPYGFNPDKSYDTTIEDCTYVSLRDNFICEQLNLTNTKINLNKFKTQLRTSKNNQMYDKLININQHPTHSEEYMRKYNIIKFINKHKDTNPELVDELIKIVSDCTIKKSKYSIINLFRV